MTQARQREEEQAGQKETRFLTPPNLATAALFACVGRDLFQKVDHHVRLADINSRDIDRHCRDDYRTSTKDKSKRIHECLQSGCGPATEHERTRGGTGLSTILLP
jgi:hypothetical protein